MAEPLTGDIPRDVALPGAYTIRVTALSPTDGSVVSGVTVANVVVTARDVATNEVVQFEAAELTSPAGTPPPSVPPPPPVSSPPVTVTYEISGTNIVLHWPAVPNAVGYEFLVDGTRVSNTWDGSRTSATFAIPPDGLPHTFKVVALLAGDTGSVTYPQVTPPPPPPPPPTGAAPLWNGVIPSNQWEYVGVSQSGPALSTRVTTASALDGITPPPQAGSLTRVITRPGDVYNPAGTPTSGWRTLGRTPNSSGAIKMYNPGDRSSFTFAVWFPTGYPGDANMWLCPVEIHETRPQGAPVPGVSPGHIIGFSAGIHVDVAGGKEGGRIVYVNQTVLPDYARAAWHIFTMEVVHGQAPAGVFELWHAQAKHGPMVPLIQRSGIGTMYEGTQNYFEWGNYRAQSGSSVTTVYLAGLREYASLADALAFANAMTL